MEKPDYKNYFDLERLVAKIQSYLPNFHADLFLKAFEFAEVAHRGQMRKDGGTPYIVHPVTVVGILADLHADEDVLISALLHDVPEDTERTIEEVRSIFGDSVGFLVDGITKLSKVQYQHNMPEREVESLKKLFLHSAKDPRVILIKLADRLHNMMTLGNISDSDKRMRIARETLEIYVQIANMLGIQELKSRLEDLCFKHISPSEFEQLEAKMMHNKEKNGGYLKEVTSELEKSLKKFSIKGEIVPRDIGIYSVYKRLLARGKNIQDLDDRFRITLVVETIPECYQALGIIHGRFVPKPNSFKDYIAHPKANGYMSLHTTLFGIKGIDVEMQIRTFKMNSEAEYGIIAPFFLDKRSSAKREGALLAKDKRAFWANRILEIQQNQESSDDFMENLKEDIFQDRIFIFTPKGATIDLPQNATVVDFAYAIHSDIGNRAVKAEINGEMKPLSTNLKTGDVVNVLTDEFAEPELSWLGIVKTSNAKEKMKAYFKKVSKEKKIFEGRRVLQNELDLAGLGNISSIKIKKLNPLLFKKTGRSYDSLEDLYIAIGEGNLNPTVAVKILSGNDNLEGLKDLDGKSQVKIDIKITTRSKFGILRQISEVFYKHAMEITYVKAWTAKKNGYDYFTFQVVVTDIAKIVRIVDELEEMEDVMSVYTVSYSSGMKFYFLAFMTSLIWITHPLLIGYFADTFKETFGAVTYDFALNLGLFGLLILVLYLTRTQKRIIPVRRNTKIFWTAAFAIPTLAIGVLFIEIFFFELKLNIFALFIEIFLVYGYLATSYFNVRKLG